MATVTQHLARSENIAFGSTEIFEHFFRKNVPQVPIQQCSTVNRRAAVNDIVKFMNYLFSNQGLNY